MRVEITEEFESYDYKDGCYFGGYFCEADLWEDSYGYENYVEYFVDVGITKFELFDVFNVDENGDEHQVTDEKFLNELAESIYYSYEESINEQLREYYNDYSAYSDEDRSSYDD